MIPLWGTFFAFAALAYITKSRTYLILAFSALVNVYIDVFTSSEDQYLMLIYSMIEFITALGVLYYGDIHKLYQTTILTMFLMTHFSMEFALIIDNVEFIESNIYTNVISSLIVLQLIGAGRGLDKLTSLPWSCYHRFKNYHLNIFNH